MLVLLACAAPASVRAGEPLRLHPKNPRYLELGGKPTVLVTSGEHYGAVINLDFDFIPYLNELKRSNLNLTRIFAGAYIEDPKAFGITANTLAPRPTRFIAPWPRSATPGYAGGGNKFDLTRWDPAYWKRLKSFVSEAGRRGIVVELVLFCPFYEDSMWALSPLNAVNNVNGVGRSVTDRGDVYNLKHADIQAIEEALVRKMVRELNAFDNLYYEICNEPYIEPYVGGAVTLTWQHRIADVIVATEKPLSRKHLIAQNIANGSAKIASPHAAVSIFNFHYASPPDAVVVNRDLAKVIADDETGFRGTADEPYRREAWQFLLAGGAIFDHLDYSFTADHEAGTFTLPPKQPGGGGASFRRQMKILREVMESVDFISMKPEDEPWKGQLPEELSARALVKPGEAHVIYFSASAGKNGDYSVRWTGSLEPALSEAYTFHALSNDGVRLWIDDKLVIDNWTDHSTTENQGRVELLGGRKVPIKLEYYQGTGGAVMKLSWSSPSLKRQIIPAEALATTDGNERGLSGEYFTDRSFGKRAFARVDRTIDFDWTVTSPFMKATPPSEDLRVTADLDVPAGRYKLTWIDTKTGAPARAATVDHGGGKLKLESPTFRYDIALTVRATK